MTTLEWFSGKNNYRKHTLETDTRKKASTYTIELLDVEPIAPPPSSFSILDTGINLLIDALPSKNRPIEVLYSGGLDSESVLLAAIFSGHKTRAVVGRWLHKGEVINEQDIYYAESFCTDKEIPMSRIDLDVGKFFSNGDHIPYLDPYRITTFSSACIFWLLEQCQSFPIIGGDYAWPQLSETRRVYSPHRHAYNCFDHFMKMKGITGIGNMLSATQELNAGFIKSHITTLKKGYRKIDIFTNLEIYGLEPRIRSHGWEHILNQDIKFDWKIVSSYLLTRYGPTKNVIKWGDNFAKLIDSTDNFNDKS